jgi:hypothetical protein
MKNNTNNERVFLGEKKYTVGNSVITDRYYQLPDGRIIHRRKTETYRKL